MNSDLFSKFAPILRSLGESELLTEVADPKRLLIASETERGRKIDVAYAPFDHVNRDADVVIVGITPGRQQMRNALMKARRYLVAGQSEAEAMKAAKIFASFSGPMRSNLIAMLDSIGLSKALGLTSTASLWNAHDKRVHFTSALRYPVFLNGENYSAAPSMGSTPILRAQLLQWFGTEMAALPKAVFIPLGPDVAEAVEAVAKHLGLPADRIMSGLPHPSGANAERIAFFLGRKAREALSNRVNPDRLLAARAALDAKIATWA
jgi:hypothetical protein